MTRVFDEDATPPEEPPPPQGNLRPLGWSTAVALLVIGGLSGWLLVSLLQLQEIPLPVTPWTMSVVLLALAGVGFWGAPRMRRRVHDAENRPTPELGVSVFSLARAMVATGLLLAGAHIAYALSQVGGLERELYRERLWMALLAVVAGLVFAASGARLERACRVE